MDVGTNKHVGTRGGGVGKGCGGLRCFGGEGGLMLRCEGCHNIVFTWISRSLMVFDGDY